MIDFFITICVLLIVFSLHILFHFVLYIRGKKSWFVTGVYPLGGIVLLGILYVLPQNLLREGIFSIRLQFTSIIIYFFVSILIIDFYATPYLKYESPVSIILRLLTHHPMTKQQLLKELQKSTKLDERYAGLRNTRLICYHNNRYTSTTLGKIIFHTVMLYRAVIGEKIERHA